MVATQTQQVINLPEIIQVQMTVPIRGTTPYIGGAFSEKARQEIRDKQQSTSRIRKTKEPKQPELEAHARTYWMADGSPAIPAVCFKAAMVRAVQLFGGKDVGLPMTEAKTMFFVFGDGAEQLVPILDAQWEMREDPVRVNNGNADLRYRNYFLPWRCEIRIGFFPHRIDQQSVLRLVQAAGIGGVGEWRPQKTNGNYGMFEIDPEREVTLR
jgi:hypothetical protein